MSSRIRSLALCLRTFGQVGFGRKRHLQSLPLVGADGIRLQVGNDRDPRGARDFRRVNLHFVEFEPVRLDEERVDALGGENVEGVSMPSRYTADISIEDAQLQAENEGVFFRVIPIESVFNSFVDLLSDEFAGRFLPYSDHHLAGSLMN